jgi:hypothetical protein
MFVQQAMNAKEFISKVEKQLHKKIEDFSEYDRQITSQIA